MPGWLDDEFGLDEEPLQTSDNWLDVEFGLNDDEEDESGFLSNFGHSALSAFLDQPRQFGALYDKASDYVAEKTGGLRLSPVDYAMRAFGLNAEEMAPLASIPGAAAKALGKDPAAFTKEYYERSRERLLDMPQDTSGASVNVLGVDLPLEPKVIGAGIAQTVADLGPDIFFPGKEAAKGLKNLPLKTPPEASQLAQEAAKTVEATLPLKTQNSAYEGLLSEMEELRNYAAKADEQKELDLNKLTVEQRAQAERMAMEANPLQDPRMIDPEALDAQPTMYEEAHRLLARENVDNALERLEATESEMLPITSNSRGVSLNRMDYEPNLRFPGTSSNKPSGITLGQNSLFRDTVDDLQQYEPAPYSESTLVPGEVNRLDASTRQTGLNPNPNFGPSPQQMPSSVSPFELVGREAREFSEDVIESAILEAEQNIFVSNAGQEFVASTKLSEDIADHIMFGDGNQDDIVKGLQKETQATMEAKEAAESAVAAFEKRVEEFFDGTPESAVKAGDELVESTAEILPPPKSIPKALQDIDPALQGLQVETLQDTVLRLEATQKRAVRKAEIIAKEKVGKLRKSGELVDANDAAAYVTSYVQEVNDIIGLTMQKMRAKGATEAEAVKEINALINRLVKQYRLDPNLPGVRKVVPNPASNPHQITAAAEYLQKTGLTTKRIEDMTYPELVEIGYKLNKGSAPTEVFDEVIQEVKKRIGGPQDKELTARMDAEICA